MVNDENAIIMQHVDLKKKKKKKKKCYMLGAIQTRPVCGFQGGIVKI